MKKREPAVAGTFYPYEREALNELLTIIYAKVKERNLKISGEVKALISPHAGYVFSGEVAASGFYLLDSEKKYNNIFLIGTSHYTLLNGASVYAGDICQVPNGEAEINKDIVSELLKYDFFEFNEDAHDLEHSLEVQLPFLFYHLKKTFKIVPILLGTKNYETIRQIAEVLRPYFEKEGNLFVISTDFSHYPPYEYAKESDKHTAKAIISNNPNSFINALIENKRKNIPGLETSICGWSAVLTLLYITFAAGNLKYEIITYKNSGDSDYGDKEGVVGYYSVAVLKKNNILNLSKEKKQKLLKIARETSAEFLKKNNILNLSKEEKQELLEIARETLEEYLEKGEIPKIDYDELTSTLVKPLGAFVTLRKNGKLRGCIGRLFPYAPLYKIVQDMAVAAATEDTRFEPVTADELKDIDIEISVLTPLQKVKEPLKEIKIGIDGIYIRGRFKSGTFLPQVATENNLTTEEFLGYCSKYKAGLGFDGWKNADVFKYQAIVFDEKDFGD